MLPRQMGAERREGYDEQVLQEKRGEKASWRDTVSGGEDSARMEVRRACGY